MNERIKKLAEQATKHYPATETSVEFSTFDKEKFAELIVKECAKVASNQVMDVEGNDWGVKNAVKRHFGVEE